MVCLACSHGFKVGDSVQFDVAKCKDRWRLEAYAKRQETSKIYRIEQSLDGVVTAILLTADGGFLGTSLYRLKKVSR